MIYIICNAMGRGQRQKNVFFRALPESPKPPPPSPQFGQLGPLFSDVKIQDLKVSLELKILYMTQLLLLGKFEYTGGPIFKVVLEC